jgi:hypothetical protein
MLCPYPDCTGQVVEGQRFCNVCGRSLDPQTVATAKQAATGAPASQPLPPSQAPPYGQPPYQAPYQNPNQAPPYANQPYGNPPQYAPPQYPPQYPPQQMPPAQPYAQGNWQGQPYAQMPVQQVAPRPTSKTPLVLFLLLLLVGGGVAAGLLLFGWRLPTVGSTSSSSSSITPTVGSRTFNLFLPVFERDNPYSTPAIKGRDGLERGISVSTRPYLTIENGQTLKPATVDVSIKAANTENLTLEQIYSAGLVFASSQELADEFELYVASQHPDYDFDAVLPAKGQSYEVTDPQGWTLKITVDEVVFESDTMTDGSPSPHPVFAVLNMTAELTPK